MSECFVVKKNTTLNKRLLFGKNVLVSVNRPVVVLKIKAKKHNLQKNPDVKLTYITIPQVENTYSAVVVKPSDMYGCYMGLNQHGVCIGSNELLSSNKKGEKGLIAIDICRLVLERTKTANEGLELIKQLLSQHSFGIEQNAQTLEHCDSSFVLCDGEGGYIVETCGQRMVARELQDIEAFSSEYMIETDYTVSNFEQKVNAKKQFAKKKLVSSNISQAKRFKMFSELIEARDGKQGKRVFGFSIGKISENQPAEGVTFKTFINILQSHNDTEQPPSENICVHHNNIKGLVSSLGFASQPENGVFFVSQGSVPCRSLFMPFSIKGELPFFEDEKQSETTWFKNEIVLRNIAAGVIPINEFIEQKQKIEKDFLLKIEQFNIAKKTEATKLNAEVFQKSQEFLDSWFLRCRLDLKGFNDKEASFLKRNSAVKQTNELFLKYENFLREEKI